MRISLEKLSILKDKKETFYTTLIITGHILFALFLSLLMASLMYTIICHKHQDSILSYQLNTINTQLNQISSTEDISGFRASLTKMNNSIASIKQAVDYVLKSTEITKISSQMGLIKKNIDELKKIVRNNNNDKEYLDASILPFQVISVDVISEQPFVSIDYDRRITPLGVGDTLAGWQITEADYAASTVEFKDSQNQYVQVTLHGQAK